MAPRMLKYPRTRHLEGSRLQPGDEDLSSVPFSELRGRYLVVEEKIDGANAGASFDEKGALWLQSRGHFLTGGPREKHFNLFKQWARTHERALSNVLGDRYLMYGEWLYAKHTIYYDALPHYFLEFDILDTHTREFLSTDRRRALLHGAPIASVPVLWRGRADSLAELTERVVRSLYKTERWRERLADSARERGLDPEKILRETDPSDLGEGLYIKVEENGCVRERYKYVRHSFLTAVTDSGSHWLNRPIVPNELAAGAALF